MGGLPTDTNKEHHRAQKNDHFPLIEKYSTAFKKTMGESSVTTFEVWLTANRVNDDNARKLCEDLGVHSFESLKVLKESDVHRDRVFNFMPLSQERSIQKLYDNLVAPVSVENSSIPFWIKLKCASVTGAITQAWTQVSIPENEMNMLHYRDLFERLVDSNSLSDETRQSLIGLRHDAAVSAYTSHDIRGDPMKSNCDGRVELMSREFRWIVFSVKPFNKCGLRRDMNSVLMSNQNTTILHYPEPITYRNGVTSDFPTDLFNLFLDRMKEKEFGLRNMADVQSLDNLLKASRDVVHVLIISSM